MTGAFQPEEGSKNNRFVLDLDLNLENLDLENLDFHPDRKKEIFGLNRLLTMNTYIGIPMEDPVYAAVLEDKL